MPLNPITPTINATGIPLEPIRGGDDLAEGIAEMFQDDEAQQRDLGERERYLNEVISATMASSLGFLRHIKSIAGMNDRVNLEETVHPEGGANRIRHLNPHTEREETSSHIFSVITAIFFGAAALFLYSSSEECKEIQKNIKTLNEDKQVWDSLFFRFYTPPYHNRVKGLFQKAIAFLEEKEKNLRANFYLRVTLLSSAILTGLSIGLKAHPFFQITAGAVCVATSFFVIKKYAQGSFFKVRLSVELRNQAEAAERDLSENLLSMAAISASLPAE
ncbi:MAG: hypothetical protein H0V82_01090 [Candidatus Protochlamydia sp.]|nr:hypothetical protein [Candidatus Protochlamydia sp.]